jgi:hypothetical protein
MNASKRPNGIPAGIALALLLAVAAPPRATAHTSPDWGPCECDSQTYTLSTPNPGGNAYTGTITVSPEKASYQRGDFVLIAYTPGEDEVFTSWSVTPSSHIASGCPDLATALHITGDTTIIPNTVPKEHTVTVSWGSAGGVVDVPAGAAAGAYHYTIPAEFGDTHTASATPDAGKRTVWHGVGTPFGDNRLGDSVTVKVNGDVAIEANFENIPDPMPTYHTASAEASGGSADFFGAIYTHSQRGARPFLGGVQTTGSFHMAVDAHPGYHFIAWEWQNNGPKFQVGESLPGSYLSMHTLTANRTYTAHLMPDLKLTFEVEGAGVLTGNFQHAWNPYPVLQDGFGMITANRNMNDVTISHHACPGWAFQHWAIKDGEGEWQVVELLPGTPLPGNLNLFMDWHDPVGAEIRVPFGQAVFEVRAVFQEAYQGSLCPCETSEWSNPVYWDSNGYVGDAFMHRVVTTKIVPFTEVQEHLIHENSFPALQGFEIDLITQGAISTWTILSTGYRNMNDEHAIYPYNKPTLVNTFNTGGSAEIWFRQEMCRVSDAFVYANHPLNYRLFPIAEGNTCGYTPFWPHLGSVYGYHCIVSKCDAFNDQVWEYFHADYCEE